MHSDLSAPPRPAVAPAPLAAFDWRRRPRANTHCRQAGHQSGQAAVMSRTATSRPPAVCPARCRPRSVRDIEDAIRGIIFPDEPAVMLSNLPGSSHPHFRDACTAELSGGAGSLFQVSFPTPGDAALPARASARPAAWKTVATAFRAGTGNRYRSLTGVIVHSWPGREPTGDDAIIARALASHALAMVRRERLARAAARADARAAKLAIDLITSRIGGEAAGILTARRQITKEEAGRLLRRPSRTSRRDRHDAAAGVVRAGGLHRLPVNRPGATARRGHLRTAASDGYTVTNAAHGPDGPHGA